MQKTNMTALISAFSRAYHALDFSPTVFRDTVARFLFSEEEYAAISKSMTDGIAFFSPMFSGSKEDALRFIINTQLGPSPLGRAAFLENSLKTAASIGAMQYVILGAGYDTFAYRQDNWATPLRIFEIDLPDCAKDKKMRLARAKIPVPQNVFYLSADLTRPGFQKNLLAHHAFHKDSISFFSAAGLSYYMKKSSFHRLLSAISQCCPRGSSFAFDYPTAARDPKQSQLAAGAGEPMCAAYSYDEVERLAEQNGFLIYEHIDSAEINKRYFAAYNSIHTACPIKAIEGVCFCLAVKR